MRVWIDLEASCCLPGGEPAACALHFGRVAMKTLFDLAIAAGWSAEHARHDPRISRLAELIRADEFEKCAKLCDARVMGDNNREDMEAKRCAADIRSFRAKRAK